MTDYEAFMKTLSVWVDPHRMDADMFYIDEESPSGTHWVTVIGEDNQRIEFDFNPDGKIIGWY